MGATEPSAEEGLMAAVEKARAHLEAEDAAREKLLSLTREVVRLSRQVVFRIHDGDVEGARKAFGQLAELVNELTAFKSTNPRLYYGGSVTGALAEYVEASALLSYVQGRPIPSFEELMVEPAHYLLGLADFAGELRRLLFRHLNEGDLPSAERALRFMEVVYRALAAIAVPEALVPGLRRKVDVLRAVIESSVRDLHHSSSSIRLERIMGSLMGKLGGGGGGLE